MATSMLPMFLLSPAHDVDEQTAAPEGLVARARIGDAAAWETLYRRVYPKLFAYGSRRLGPDGARDAVGETMARAVARIDRFVSTATSFDAWLFGILRHVVHDTLRTQHRLVFSDDASLGDGALDHLLGAETTAAVRAAFCRLPAFDQEVLELRVVGGLSSEEVAAVVGKRPGAVRMAQARALDRMRALLEEEP